MLWRKNKYKVLQENHIDLPGLVVKYGINKSGLLYAILRPNQMDESWYDYWFVGISLEKGILWEYNDPDFRPDELRIDKAGDAYISDGSTILRISKDGEIKENITFKLDADQIIGSFVLLEDGFIISLQGKEKPNAKVIRTDFNGKIKWDCMISEDGIAYKGLVQMSAANNWQPEQMPAWTPRSWNPSKHDEIIISGENVLATFADFPGSGIGMAYCLNIHTGLIKWKTKPAPFESIAGLPGGRFLIGYQGYGAFESELYSSDGEIIDSWESAGKLIVTPNEQLFSIEMANLSNAALHHVELKSGGKIEKGIRIPGYYIVYPAIDEFSNIVFWRDQKLMLIDKEGNLSSLFSVAPTKRDWNCWRILLYKEGIVIFSVNERLYILKTNLGKLAQSPWACKFSNNERNPVI